MPDPSTPPSDAATPENPNSSAPGGKGATGNEAAPGTVSSQAREGRPHDRQERRIGAHKELERDLGLYAVITISIGAMIGSGIFVLPGLATKIGGPGVVLAYFLAGLVVLPAALSKAEMATAMPEAGGTYLFVDRALGPFLGTIAGLGVWFAMTFKSAFALVGLGAYLVLFADMPTRPVSLGLGLLLVLVNMIGVKQTGRLQALIVTAVLTVLLLFIGGGGRELSLERFAGFFDVGAAGILAATGFVFVSYAGVTKIASVAEEVRRPERTIPLGMLLSIGTMMFVYSAINAVLIGVLPRSELTSTLTPMAAGAAAFWGRSGLLLISVTAILALTSMANAGVLLSSRYPFAMSRHHLAPAVFQRVHPRFKTPVAAIALTGTMLLLLVAFVPVVELAKLASAFTIVIFCLVNVALIAFRQGKLTWYQPAFRSPAYPWVQFFGIGAGLVLLTQMGWLPIVGAVGITLGGVSWYWFYGRARADREGVATTTLRRRRDDLAVGRTREAISHEAENAVLIPVFEGVPPERERDLLRIARALVRKKPSVLHVGLFEELPDQLELQPFLAEKTADELAFERFTADLVRDLDAPVKLTEVVGHDWKRALLFYIRDHHIDLVLTEEIKSPNLLKPLSRDARWLMRRSGVEIVVLGPHPLGELREIQVLGAGGPFDALKVDLANRIAISEGARIRFVQVLPRNATAAQIEAAKSYHAQLDRLCQVPTHSDIQCVSEPVSALRKLATTADLVIVGATLQRRLQNPLRGDLEQRLAATLDRPYLLVHARRTPRRKRDAHSS